MDKARREPPERHERPADAPRRGPKPAAQDRRPATAKASVIVFPAEG